MYHWNAWRNAEECCWVNPWRQGYEKQRRPYYGQDSEYTHVFTTLPSGDKFSAILHSLPDDLLEDP